MVTDKAAKTALKREAIGIRNFLRALKQVKASSKIVVKRGTDASSFYVDVAELDGGIVIEVWLDRCANDEYNLWIGITGSKNSIENIIAGLPKKLRPRKQHLTLKDYKLKRSGRKKYHVYKNMKSGDLKHPFFEVIGKAESYFGIYLFGNSQSNGLPRFELSEAYTFLYLFIGSRKVTNQREDGDAAAPFDAINDIGSDFPKTFGGNYTRFARDERVRSAVLKRAKGKCEFCGQSGFLMSDGSRYLESHHIIALAKDGADKLSNVIALCPNDHREAHFGERRIKLEKRMVEVVKKLSGVV